MEAEFCFRRKTRVHLFHYDQRLCFRGFEEPTTYSTELEAFHEQHLHWGVLGVFLTLGFSHSLFAFPYCSLSVRFVPVSRRRLALFVDLEPAFVHLVKLEVEV